MNVRKIRLTVLTLSTLLGLCYFAIHHNPPPKIQRARPVMGTIGEITVYESDTAKADAAIDAAFLELERLNKLMSDYLPESLLSQLNRTAHASPQHVDTELFELITRAQAFAKASNGAFDITVCPLIILWGFKNEISTTLAEENSPSVSSARPLPSTPLARTPCAPVIPSATKMTQTQQQVGYQHLHLDPISETVRFLRPGMSLDLGGIGKGYAVDRTVAVLKQEGIESGVVSLGGDIRCFGKEPCHLAIQHPYQEKPFTTLTLTNQAIATSGNYEKFFDIKGKRYAHILDPRTGWPVSGILSTSVITNTAEAADMLATAIFVLGESEGRPLLQQYHAEALWLLPGPSHTIHTQTTPHFFH